MGEHRNDYCPVIKVALHPDAQRLIADNISDEILCVKLDRINKQLKEPRFNQ